MKKTILASAVLLAFGSVASATDLQSGEISVSYGSDSYLVKNEINISTSNINLPLFDAANGDITVNFEKDSTLRLESSKHEMVYGHGGKIQFNLGDNGKLDMTSHSTGSTYESMLSGNVTVQGGSESTLILTTTGNDVPLGDSHLGGEININVNTLHIISASSLAIMRQNGNESLAINAKNIYIKGQVQQGGGGNTSITGFDALDIDASSSRYAIRAASGKMTFEGNENSVVTLESSGFNTEDSAAVIGTATSDADLAITAGTINISATADNDQSKAIDLASESSKVTLTAKQAITITGNVSTTTNATLSLDSQRTDVKGDISSSLGTIDLAGELLFNGSVAEIGKLTGDKATFTITNTEQHVSIKNDSSNLTLAATGDVNDAAGIDALKEIALTGTVDGVNLVAREGMYSKETTAQLDGEGNMVNVVTKDNSIMSNVLDLASATTLSLNRILMNDVRKRMGDLRSAEGTSGVWARYDGGRLSGSNDLENDFTTIQVGIDTVPSPDSVRFGVAFAYTTTDADLKRGGAEMDAYSLAFYGTKFYDNGAFFDVIGRFATADSDVTIDGNKDGSMDNLALSLSGEFGWRFDVTESMYVEPQAEVTYTYIDAEDLKLSSGHEYRFDSIDSLIGRVGFAAGLKCPNNFGDVYVRASAVHEFLGDAAVRGGAYVQELDGQDTWVEFGIGANFNLGKSTYIYADLERSEGAELDVDWRANLGIRYSF